MESVSSKELNASKTNLNNLQTQLDALLNKIEGYIEQEKKLTKDSANEQNNANLDQCSDKEFEEFQKLNK